MSQENVEIVRRTYDAFNRRNREGLLDLINPAFVADMSRSLGPERGIYEGVAGLSRLLDRYWDAFSEFLIEPSELIDCGNQVVAATRGRGIGRSSGARAEARGTQVWNLSDGSPVRWTVYQSKAEALEAVGLSE